MSYHDPFERELRVMAWVFCAAILVIGIVAYFSAEKRSSELDYLKAHSCEVVHSEKTGRRAGGKISYDVYRHTAQCDGFIYVFEGREDDKL